MFHSMFCLSHTSRIDAKGISRTLNLKAVETIARLVHRLTATRKRVPRTAIKRVDWTICSSFSHSRKTVRIDTFKSEETYYSHEDYFHFITTSDSGISFIFNLGDNMATHHNNDGIPRRVLCSQTLPTRSPLRRHWFRIILHVQLYSVLVFPNQRCRRIAGAACVLSSNDPDYILHSLRRPFRLCCHERHTRHM